MTEELKPIIRIMLYIISGRMVAGGWLPPDVADMISADPAFLEFVTGLVVMGGTFCIYMFSNARKALKGA